MPQLEEALFAYLTADAGVSAIVEERVYPTRTPEGSGIPAVSYQRISARRIPTFDRFDVYDAWTQARVQINCWAHTALGAMELGEAVLLALSGYEGDMSGQLIGSSDAVDEFDTYEVTTKKYRRILDFLISYEDDLVVES